MKTSLRAKSIVLVGGGGHCKVVIQILREQDEYEIRGISDLSDRLGQNILGVPINVTDGDLAALKRNGVEHAFVTLGSIGDPRNRVHLFDMIKAIGFSVPVVRSIHSVVAPDVQIGEGTVLMPGAIVNSGTRIGRNCILNTGCSVDHDCVMGDNVHLAPGVIVSGGVRIGSGTHIGSGSVVIQSIEVGAYSLVGAGSVVVKNVPSHVKVYGNPARVRAAFE